MIDLLLIAGALAFLLSLKLAYWYGWQRGSDDAYYWAGVLLGHGIAAEAETHVDVQRRVAREGRQ